MTDRPALELLIGRQLTQAEAAIDVVKLDRALAKAKDRVDKAIRDEMVAAAETAWAGGLPPRLQLTAAITGPLDELRRLGREEAGGELERLGYTIPDRRLAARGDRGPDPWTTPATWIKKRLVALSIYVGDTLDDAEASGATRGSMVDFRAIVIDAVRATPGGRDIASRVVSRALMRGYQDRWEDLGPDVIAGWEYTAILDSGTCEECAPLDGTVYDTLEELYAVLPGFGPNPDCLGQGRCRCRAVPTPAAGG